MARRSRGLTAILVLATALAAGCAQPPAADGVSAEPVVTAAPVSTPRAQAVAFARTFLQLDAEGARAQQALMLAPALRQAMQRAQASERRGGAGRYRKQAAADQWSYFGLADAWRPGRVSVHALDARRAEVDVDMLVDGAEEPVAIARLELVRANGAWLLDDIRQGNAAAGGLRAMLESIR